MKKIFALVFTFVLLLACNSSKPGGKVAAPGSSETAVKDVEVKKSESKDVSELTDYMITADSTLVDSTNIGFNYDSAMVADKDFSTAWCNAEGGSGGELVIDFSQLAKADVFGIVPGFGRDEKIYLQNNRVKELAVEFADDKGDFADQQVFTFPDEYKMHFVDLKGKEFSKIKFTVKDVYKGSKYKDTCISEIDFWSDYVGNKDLVAAMNYYNKYKKDFALEPFDIVGEVLVSDSKPNVCNTPIKADSDFFDDEFVSLDAGDKVYVSAVINEYGEEGDKLNVKWYSGARPETLLLESEKWFLMDSMQDVPVIVDCNGKLYAHVVSDEPKWGPFKVQFYNDKSLIGSAKFSMTQ